MFQRRFWIPLLPSATHEALADSWPRTRANENTHSSPGLKREEGEGGKNPCFDWTADSEVCLNFFRLSSVGDVRMSESDLAAGFEVGGGFYG